MRPLDAALAFAFVAGLAVSPLLLCAGAALLRWWRTRGEVLPPSQTAEVRRLATGEPLDAESLRRVLDSHEERR